MTQGPERPGSLTRLLALAPARWLAAVGVLAAMLAVIGFATRPVLGGLGPALFWLGSIAAPLALAAAWWLSGVLVRRPELCAPLQRVASGTVQAVLVLGLAAVAAELRVGSTHPLPRQVMVTRDPLVHLQRPHPELGWIGAPSYALDMDFLSGRTHFATNARGFRDLEQEVDPTRLQVVVIGDSFPIGWGNPVAASAGPVLREALPEVQVFNAAWQGWSKDQIAWSYDLLARPLDPEVVVMMFVADPAVDTSRPIYDGLRKPYYLLAGDHLELFGKPVPYPPGERANIEYFRTWEAARVTGPLSALAYLCRELPRTRTALGARLFPDYDWAEVDRAGLPPLDAIETEVLRQLAARVAADRADLILVPSPRALVLQHARDPAAAMRAHLRSYRRLGIDTVDITPLLLPDWRACMNADEHLNAEGMRRIQGPVAERIRAALRVPR